MENILIVLAILIICSSLGGTQLPKLPGAILSLGALALAFFNGHSRENMASVFYSIPLLLVIIGVITYLSEKKLATEGENATFVTKILGGSIFQVVFIMVLTTYFLSTFFFPHFS